MGRQLLTNLTSSSSSSPANGTGDLPCTDFCDPSCGDFDECYTFPAIPDDPLPPSLPPSPTAIVATPSSSNNDSAFHFSPIAIVVIAVLAAAFLFISYYAILVKYFSLLSSFFTRRHPNRIPGPHSPPDADADLISPNHHDHHHHPFVDHPIWLISTVGLHQSIINSITVIPYKKEDELIDGTDCSVCLSEFQQGETLRLLPKCKHAFHIDCIDTWLRSHTNCPMCRAAIVLTSGRPSTDPSFGHSRRAELTILPDSDSSDIESGITHPRPRPRPPGTISISSSNSSMNHNHSHSHNVGLVVGENRSAGTGHVEASGNNNNNNNNENHQENKGDDEYIAILVRRSYSMDCQNEGVQPSNSNSNSSALMATSSSRSLPSRVTILNRSYSWSERVFSHKDRNSVMSP